MRDFKREKRFGAPDSRGGGGRSFGNRDFGGNRGGDREMFKAVCSNCGKECEVPFRPTNGKPVFCRDCFRENNGGDNRRTESRPDTRRDSRPSFDSRPSPRPDFGGGRPSDSNSYKEQFDALNYKLDRILKILVPAVSVKSQSSEQPKVKEVKDENVVREEDMQLVPEKAIPVVKKKKVSKKATIAVPVDAVDEVKVPESVETPAVE